MASRNAPVTLRLGSMGKIRCASNRKYAAVQQGWDPVKKTYRLKVLARSDSPYRLAMAVKRLGGWSFVFELGEGALLWQNTSSEWFSLEQTILNYEAKSTL